jgi:hypothetical protein
MELNKRARWMGHPCCCGWERKTRTEADPPFDFAQGWLCGDDNKEDKDKGKGKGTATATAQRLVEVFRSHRFGL